MLYNEHSVDKFTICLHTQALRHKYNTKNTLHFRFHIMPHKALKYHNIRASRLHHGADQR